MQVTVKTTKKDEIIDITDIIEKHIAKSGSENGSCLVFVKHTTCAITTADLDAGTDLDFLDFLRGIVPNLNFRHPHDPAHAPDHFLASIIGPSVVIPFSENKLNLGTWQRIVLVELSGPRERSVEVRFL
jgi:secondary thiamine-phosphate synthase enzyme